MENMLFNDSQSRAILNELFVHCPSGFAGLLAMGTALLTVAVMLSKTNRKSLSWFLVGMSVGDAVTGFALMAASVNRVVNLLLDIPSMVSKYLCFAHTTFYILFGTELAAVMILLSSFDRY